METVYEKLDLSDLALKMLEWEKKRKELEMMEALIEYNVLSLGKTQNVGNVRVTYSKGRKTYDYQNTAIAHDADEAIIDAHTSTPAPVINWRGVCEEIGLSQDAIRHRKGEPSAKIKLV